MKAIVLVSIGLAFLSGCSVVTDKGRATPGPGAASAMATTADPAREAAAVIAYYFHGTVRCETCLTIERQARELITRRFLAAVEFKSVDYDPPENAHYRKDYQLPCPSLVLVRQNGGKG